MGSMDEPEHFPSPGSIKIEGVTTEESNVDENRSPTERLHSPKEEDLANMVSTEASIHLVVDNDPIPFCVGRRNEVKDSYKFIQICDSGFPEASKPMLNGNIPSKADIPSKPHPMNFMEEGMDQKKWKASRWQITWCLSLLLFANLLNYMDRVTIAGVLLEIKKYYGIDNAQAGLLQTAFICSYMVLSPIFGYLGDRYNRKLIMAIGILFWSIVTLAGSFVPQDKFWLFLVLRGLVGVGEASYSTIAPTIIADLFVKDMRTKALAVFYFAIPVGSGLGYIVGSNVAKAMGEWQWALRVTPGLGVLCVLGIVFIVKEPPRGASEGGINIRHTSWGTDLHQLTKNKSFILSSLGFTCVAFVAGALSLWAPAFMQYSIRTQQQYESESMVSLIFGVITCIAGFIGVGVGSESARRLRKSNSRADPLVCAFGLLCSAPFLYLSLIVSKYNTVATWVLIFIGETFLCLNWAIVTDIILYIVIPTRRSTASAFQILLSHFLGDAGSPYLIGVVSDSIKKSHVPLTAGEPAANFISLQYALYICCFVAVLGGGFFLMTALFVNEDRARADRIIKGTAVASNSNSDSDSSPVGDNYKSLPRLPPDGEEPPTDYRISVVT